MSDLVNGGFELALSGHCDYPDFTPDEVRYMRDFYELGFNSRKAEVGELKWLLRNANAQADNFCKKSVDLQSRIDRAMKSMADCQLGLEDVYQIIEDILEPPHGDDEGDSV